MSLLVSKVPRSLEMKTRLFGFELGDLLLVFLYLTLSNLAFGSTKLKFPIVWMGTLLLGSGLYFLKRGKAENYLQHSIEYLRQPPVLSSGMADTQYQPYMPLKDCEEGNLHEDTSKKTKTVL